MVFSTSVHVSNTTTLQLPSIPLDFARKICWFHFVVNWIPTPNTLFGSHRRAKIKPKPSWKPQLKGLAFL
jgi:hypothetical protein